VGFLAEWQRYAQLVEASRWRDGRIEQEKLDKMSGVCCGRL
jgi:hypothetical protein